MKTTSIKHNASLAVLASISFVAVGTGAPSSAQEVGGELDDGTSSAPQSDSLMDNVIVVTATKREQDAQDVPISISAFSGDQLTSLGIQTTADLALVAPGLQLSSPGGEGNTGAITLRGVGQNDFNDHQEGPVAIYMDEVYNSSLAHTTFQIFDLDRVEVLRGPQGTLFGRNATGGLVHFISRKPTDYLDGYVDFRFGRVKDDFNEFRAEGAIGGPLGSNVQGRISFAAHQRQAFFENLLPNGLGGSDRGDYAGRIQIAYQPTSSLDIELQVRGSESDTNAARSRQLPTFPGENGLATVVPIDVDIFGTGPGNDPAGFRNTEPDFWSGEFDRDGNLDKTQWGVTGKATYGFGDFELVSITDYSEFENTFEEDVDQGPFAGLGFEKNSDIQQFSQEIRLAYSSGPLDVVAGGYLLDIDGVFDAQYLLFPLYTAGLGIGPDGLGSRVDFVQDTTSLSVFGQLDLEIVPDVTLTAGVRYTDEDRDFGLVSVLFPAVDADRASLEAEDADGIQILDFLGDRNDGFVSWKGGISWEPDPSLLLYASVTRGQKAGGFNAPALASPAEAPFLSFEPEELTSFEGGVKYTGDGLVRRINGSIYYYAYEDYQAFQFQNLSALIFNADAEVSGIDLDVLLVPFSGLTLNFGSAIIFEATAEDVGLPSGVIADQRLPLTPDLFLTGLVRYDWTLGTGEASVQIDGKYQTEQNFAVLNAPATEENDYAVFNARLGYTFDQPNIEISAFVENLFEEEYRSFVFDTGLGVAEQFPGAPRTYGVQLTYRFN